jgi:hypothetical protein
MVFLFGSFPKDPNTAGGRSSSSPEMICFPSETCLVSTFNLLSWLSSQLAILKTSGRCLGSPETEGIETASVNVGVLNDQSRALVGRDVDNSGPASLSMNCC